MEGKAKEDFEAWFWKSHSDCKYYDWKGFIKISTESMQWGVIQDWLDSVGIWVSVDKGTSGYYGLLKVSNGRALESQWVNTEMNPIEDLNESRTAAIEKAVETYNART